MSCFLTPTSTKFLLLHLPHAPNTPPPVPNGGGGSPHPTSSSSSGTGGAGGAAGVFPPFAAYTTAAPPSSLLARAASSTAAAGGGSTATVPTNATSPQTEEALRLFFTEVYEAWVKAVMNPFQGINQALGSPVFRARVLTAGKKFL